MREEKGGEGREGGRWACGHEDAVMEHLE